MDRETPDREQCLLMMARAGMPDNIRRHSLLVAELARAIAARLRAGGLPLDVSLVEAVGLLHDIGKARGLETGESHAELGAAMLEAEGLGRLAPAVRAHVVIEARDLDGPLTEALVVNYADKRVRHEELVSLDERFEDLWARYGGAPGSRAVLEGLLALYRRLEKAIFSRLGLEPDAAAELLESARRGLRGSSA